MPLLGKERAERPALAAGADGGDLDRRLAGVLGEGGERRGRRRARRDAAGCQTEKPAAVELEGRMLHHDQGSCNSLSGNIPAACTADD